MQLHIKYLRSMGDDPVTRRVCVQYLRDSLIYFYPEKPHILHQAELLAAGAGRTFGVPGSVVEIFVGGASVRMGVW